MAESSVRTAPHTAFAESVSSYLQASRSDDIAWHPWGEAAFAHDNDKLRFVAIGFAACHNCHRMHAECFEDAGVCSILRESFVAVKVRAPYHAVLAFSFPKPGILLRSVLGMRESRQIHFCRITAPLPRLSLLIRHGIFGFAAPWACL